MDSLSPVLILNQDYSPLNVCNARKAIVLLGKSKAETIVASDVSIRSSYKAHILPEVIRLHYYLKRPFARRKLSRRDVFTRDGNRCQYCSVKGPGLTIDHVLPRSKGGRHEWSNVVGACRRCNQKKAGQTLKEAGMNLVRQPIEPAPHPYACFISMDIKPTWLVFMPWLSESAGSDKVLQAV